MKNVLIVFGIAFVVLFITLISVMFSATAGAVAKGVSTIYVTENSRYIIDKNRSLCFYETFTNYVVVPIEVNCTKIIYQ